MHKTADISISDLSKIEGHAGLDVKIRGGKVEEVKLKISENKRFYTQGVRGKSALSVPLLVSRICGTCSIAHLTCCIEAVEKALKVKPSQQTVLLRNLLMNGLMIRDHAMHLYLFSLPDVFGKDSVLEFSGPKEEKFVKQAFKVKGVGNKLCTLIGGRAVHPSFAQVGCFSKIPDKAESKKLVLELKSCRQDVLELIEVFYNSTMCFESKTNYVALVTKEYSFLEGCIMAIDGTCIDESRYWDHLNRVVIPYSQATAFEFEGREYRVGALARLNLNKENLNPKTKKDVSKYLNVFPSNNIFHNNLAQAIEMLHCIDYSVEKLESTEFKEEPKPEIVLTEGKGVGVIEAPRGTLYYLLDLDKSGKVRFANLVIPTAQNQIHIGKDIRDFLPSVLEKDQHEIEHDLEKLIRAYDPCMSCATHFLKVRWK